VWNALSAQELQVARMAAEGLSNRQIGERLYMSHRTVASHLYHIFPKLGITSRAQLTAMSLDLPTAPPSRPTSERCRAMTDLAASGGRLMGWASARLASWFTAPGWPLRS
jgi:DNA-binding CsgD family transcriptional regulator